MSPKEVQNIAGESLPWIGHGYAAFFGTIFGVYFAVLCVGSYTDYQKALACQTWSTVQAELGVRSDVYYKRTSQRYETFRYYPVISYTYKVEGRNYTGHLSLPETFNIEDAQGKLIQKMSELQKGGSKFVVYYDPNSPADALAERGDPKKALTDFQMYLTLLILAALAAAWGIISIVINSRLGNNKAVPDREESFQFHA